MADSVVFPYLLFGVEATMPRSSSVPMRVLSLLLAFGLYMMSVGYGRGKWRVIVMRNYCDMFAHSRERVIVDLSPFRNTVRC